MTAFRRKDIDPVKFTKLWNDRSISTAAIAERFGVNPNAISQKARKLGLEPRTKNYKKCKCCLLPMPYCIRNRHKYIISEAK